MVPNPVELTCSRARFVLVQDPAPAERGKSARGRCSDTCSHGTHYVPCDLAFLAHLSDVAPYGLMLSTNCKAALTAVLGGNSLAVTSGHSEHNLSCAVLTHGKGDHLPSGREQDKPGSRCETIGGWRGHLQVSSCGSPAQRKAAHDNRRNHQVSIICSLAVCKCESTSQAPT